ncbi:MAG TPA: protein kinase, partial [Blastocatellia bacterium]|nr:protein kinase [Blastocatellia bacterium]
MNNELSAGTTFSHYRIVSKLGVGGMGEVWLAEDTRLGRKVALKLLPAEFTEDSERVRRFTLEAKSAAALNHPNLAHIYEIGEANGLNFIAMEFVDGPTLREAIHNDNNGLRTLLKHLLQVADGLAKAHGSGIVHRDLK